MKKSGIIMMLGAFLLLSLFVFPIWRITIGAPQYPDPLGMHIWINKIADQEPNDIKNIDLLNHYVGMAKIPVDMPEFDIFPKVIGGMVLLGIIIGFVGKRKLYLTWFLIMVVLGSAGMYDFYLWEYEYGHNLDPTAAIKFTDSEGNPLAYQPPLIGNKTILNFEARSWPMTGAYLMFLGMSLSVVAFIVDKKEEANSQ
ncbi:MAG: hypothetical protein L3J06_08940 [Cyclobacteriaceae bacterium]|nr:hypothetical protein [Cyclobacteriaceae bacterium]